MSMDLFITAAGTEIGKTFVAERLIGECLDRGISCDAVKPVITGFDESTGSDTARLLSAMKLPCNEATVEACSPWRFRAPLSPNLAAAREQRHIALDELLDFCRRPSEARLRLIEGIGGVMVPLDEQVTVLDWIAALGAPTLLVTGSYLGAISHALTAYSALHSRDITVQAVVVSQSIEEPVALEDTRATIAQFTDAVPVVTLARDGTICGTSFDFDALREYPSLLEALELIPPGGI